jgi:beta-lactamase superfamily II metal-dependent hydrolase
MKCEIEFLPVGDASKAGDAIVIRYGEPDAFWLMTIDGGNIDSGELVVEHIRKEFGPHAYISHAVLTHSDADHASGLRHILREIEVKALWMNAPWWFVDETRPYFLDKADQRLQQKIASEYDLIMEILKIAQNRKTSIHSAFAGAQIGPFHVLSPHREFYMALVSQFDRTPEPDQAAIEAVGFWIGKQPDSALKRAYEAVVAKAQKWIKESWDVERLKDGGITNASNESSTILYGQFDNNARVLLTGDAGVKAFSHAAIQAERMGFSLQNFNFIQVPHHGSRRNVGPTILNQVIGPILPKDAIRYQAFVSAPKDDESHPRKIVLNAFNRRGYRVDATQGVKKVYLGGFSPRPDYESSTAIPFSTTVEDYD